ncbi:MAG TPA: D-isomer specific 2-hydroxyacid dehydrogenase family protein [Mycobacteriales bacterium]|nr:D-isomer specific 2-hydroxyacid dehydrogenase family protein [Mycobacteriales bacterium]
MTTAGITVYGCEPDEAALFRDLAPRLGAVTTLTAAAPSELTAPLAHGNPCISISHKTPVSNETLAALGEAGVRYVSTRSVGHNHLDVAYAESIGILVEPVAYSPDSVADYTLMLMLMALRHARSVLRRTELHDYRLNDQRGHELRDLTVGVVGTGRIGTAVIDRLRGFGCRILAYDTRPTSDADYVVLDDLLERSDVVTLHTPLTPETHHLLDGERLKRMKPGAILVNTGRGGLVETGALVAVLECRHLGGAALDVLEGEDGIFYADCRDKPVGSELLLRLHRLPNVLISPHTAYFTDHALSDTVTQSLTNCLTFMATSCHV